MLETMMILGRYHQMLIADNAQAKEGTAGERKETADTPPMS
jgi:hypothetical protein